MFILHVVFVLVLLAICIFTAKMRSSSAQCIVLLIIIGALGSISAIMLDSLSAHNLSSQNLLVHALISPIFALFFMGIVELLSLRAPSNETNKMVKDAQLEMLNTKLDSLLTALNFTPYLEKLPSIEELNTLKEDYLYANHNNFEILGRRFDKALAQVSQNASEEMIEGLKNVIVHFNKNLRSQFGENFRELNLSVQKLLNWQENYKSLVYQYEENLSKNNGLINTYVLHLQSSKELLEKSQSAMDSALIMLDKITSTQASANTFYEKNANVLENTKKNQEALALLVEKTSTLLPDSKLALANINKAFEEMQANIVKGVENALIRMSEKSTQDLQIKQDALVRFLQGLAMQYAKIIKKITQDSLNTPKEAKLALIDSVSELKDSIAYNVQLIQSSLESSARNMSEISSEMSQHLSQNVEKNKELSAQLRDSLRLLDDALRAQTQDFAKNYQWFLDRIKELMGTR